MNLTLEQLLDTIERLHELEVSRQEHNAFSSIYGASYADIQKNALARLNDIITKATISEAKETVVQPKRGEWVSIDPADDGVPF